MTNERHRNSILNNGQHLFTLEGVVKMLGKGETLSSELWNLAAIRHFIFLNRQILPWFAV
jgi:hypothetical protein